MYTKCTPIKKSTRIRKDFLNSSIHSYKSKRNKVNNRSVSKTQSNQKNINNSKLYNQRHEPKNDYMFNMAMTNIVKLQDTMVTKPKISHCYSMANLEDKKTEDNYLNDSGEIMNKTLQPEPMPMKVDNNINGFNEGSQVNDHKLYYCLKTLDLEGMFKEFNRNYITFNDLFILSKDDLIELKVPLGPRNRLLHFAEEYKKTAHDYDFKELTDFFQKNRCFMINNLQENNLSSNNKNCNEKSAWLTSNNNISNSNKEKKNDMLHMRNQAYDKQAQMMPKNNSQYNSFEENHIPLYTHAINPPAKRCLEQEINHQFYENLDSLTFNTSNHSPTAPSLKNTSKPQYQLQKHYQFFNEQSSNPSNNNSRHNNPSKEHKKQDINKSFELSQQYDDLNINIEINKQNYDPIIKSNSKEIKKRSTSPRPTPLILLSNLRDKSPMRSPPKTNVPVTFANDSNSSKKNKKEYSKSIVNEVDDNETESIICYDEKTTTNHYKTNFSTNTNTNQTTIPKSKTKCQFMDNVNIIFSEVENFQQQYETMKQRNDQRKNKLNFLLRKKDMVDLSQKKNTSHITKSPSFQLEKNIFLNEPERNLNDELSKCINYQSKKEDNVPNKNKQSKINRSFIDSAYLHIK